MAARAEAIRREREADEAQAMCVVHEILRRLSDPNECSSLLEDLDLPANEWIVAGEFDSILQRWMDEEA